MKKIATIFVFCVVAFSCAIFLFGCDTQEGNNSSAILSGDKSKNIKLLSKEDPVVINIWTYYGSRQKDVLDEFIETFNQTRGAELGIIVEQITYGSCEDLRAALLKVSSGAGGYSYMPDIFMAHIGVASELEKNVDLVDLKGYFSEEELDEYVEELFANSSLISEPDTLKMLPVCCSGDVLVINRTEFDKYANIGILSYADLGSYQSIAAAAERYYDYTDALTEEAGDGKALFGLDTFQSLVFKSFSENGVELLDVVDGKEVLNISRPVFRKMYDNIYLSFLQGYYLKDSMYVTNDIRRGLVLVGLCSSERIPYFPKTVVGEDGEMHDIQIGVADAPSFHNLNLMFPIHNGGAFVVNRRDKSVIASVEFLKWLTNEKNNLEYALKSSYIPIRKTAFNQKTIEELIAVGKTDEVSGKVLLSLIDKFEYGTPYEPVPTIHYQEVKQLINDKFIYEITHGTKTFANEISSGVPHDVVLENLSSDECFERWYNSIVKAIESVLKK